MSVRLSDAPIPEQKWRYQPVSCSKTCAAELRAYRQDDDPSPLTWDGTTRYAVQLPLPLVWRVVCMLCGRDRWLRLPMAEMRRLRVGPCATCQGFRVVELDLGMQRPGNGLVDAA